MGPIQDPDEIRAHERVWRSLYDKTDRLLETLGEKGYRDGADYWIVDDDWGWDVLQVEFQNLDLLRPGVVRLLQAILVDYPEWMITLRVDQRGKGREMPGMGLRIYPRKVVDDLKREFLPEEFRELRFG